MDLVPGVPAGPDGCPLDPLDVYRQVIAVHPWLGGSGRALTGDEKALLVPGPREEDDPFGDGPIGRTTA